MNSKKVKQLRKALKAMGINAKEKEYNAGSRISRELDHFDIKTGKMEKRKFIYQGTIALKPECGRAKYLSVKQGMRV